MARLMVLRSALHRRSEKRPRILRRARRHQWFARCTGVRSPGLISSIFVARAYFDIALGRIVRQQIELDKVVLGYQGPASSMHYVTRSSDELLTPGTKAILKPVQTARVVAGSSTTAATSSASIRPRRSSSR